MQPFIRFGLLIAVAILTITGCAPTTVNVVSQYTGNLPTT